VPKMKFIIRPLAMWIVVIFFINFVSSLFFIFFPVHFPYDISIFSGLYIKTEVSIWLIIPPIMFLRLMLIPSNMIKKIIVVVSTLCYAVMLGFIRYIFFLYSLEKLRLKTAE
jgi:hypothetical protein